jgi:hypothetical protein
MKNQLELELGILTDSQQERVNSFIEKSKKSTEWNVEQETKTEKLLISGGFKAGIDYVNDLEYGMVNEDKEFGYGDTAFTTNVTYMRSLGGCKIIFNMYNEYKNEIETKKSSVRAEHNKLECSSITSQYRAYLPSSLFTKLKENNEKAQNKYDSVNREQAIINYTVNKYKTLFPKANVKASTDYIKNYKNSYESFPTVMIKFESDSYVIFRLGYENDKEYVHKKFDAVASKLTAIELLNIFNDQNIK